MKCTAIYNAHAQLLIFSLNLLFSDVLSSSIMSCRWIRRFRALLALESNSHADSVTPFRSMISLCQRSRHKERLGDIFALEHFFRVYIASSKHEEGWENSRQFREFSQPLSV